MSFPLTIKNVVKKTVVAPDGTSQEYFSGQMSSAIAKEVTFVPVIAEEAKARKRRTYLNETDNGYQRPGVSRRMEAFADYLDEYPLRYTPAVVLSGRGAWVFQEQSNSIIVEGPAAIIDGQHRVGGFVCAYERTDFARNIDFVVLNLPTILEEEKTFVAINSNAKNVATGIVAVIGRSADIQVAEALNNHQSSILKGRFYIAQSSPGTLFNISSVAKEIGTTFNNGAFLSILHDIDLKFDIMLAYWEEIASAFPEAWADIDKPKNQREYKLLELTGFIAWSKAASEILAPAYDPGSQTVDWEKVRKSIDILAQDGVLDWTKNGEFKNATGNVGAQLIHRKIQLVLAQNQIL
jgi:DNA sulfur modification protein DndB